MRASGSDATKRRRDAGRRRVEFLSLGITKSCNLKCKGCYEGAESGGGARSNGIPIEKLKELVDSAANLEVRTVQAIGGEPLLDEDLLELMGYARYKGIPRLEVFTNLTLFTDYFARRLRELNVSLAVSLHSYRAEVHDAITGVPGSFARTVSGLAMARMYQIPVRVAMVVQSENKDDIDQTMRFAYSLGVYSAGWEWVRPFGRGESLETPQEKKCEACWSSALWVKSTGLVSRCVMTDVPIGNIFEDSLEDILDNDPLFGPESEASELIDEPDESVEALVGVPELVTIGAENPMGCFPGGESCSPNWPCHPPGCQPVTLCPPAIGPDASGVAPVACIPHGGTGPCFPGSRPPDPCSPHVCGPGSGPCYPLGSGRNATGRGEVFGFDPCIPHGGPGPCFPGSTTPNPCAPHICMPGNGPCWPVS